MRKHGPDVRNLIDARRRAAAYGMFISDKADCYLLYRDNPHGRPTFVGRVLSTQALLDLVRRASTTRPARNPAPTNTEHTT